ncbi:hypothetical protein RB195_000935 [Necator americanus]|uniref:Uncharacterized protein n=1 Tax=Necator americanus TaxID=51031 RepID=A0ABR1DEY6_NECAM
MKSNPKSKLDSVKGSAAHPDHVESHRGGMKTNEAETMLKELNGPGKRKGLRINRKKTQFMKNVNCEDGRVQLEGFQIVGTPS